MSGDHATATVNLLKTVGGRDKLYKMSINLCKILIAQQMVDPKGSTKKVEGVLGDARKVMRLGAWIENGKKCVEVAKKGKTDYFAVIEFFAALTSFMYKICNNIGLLIGKGVPISVDSKALGKREKWWQFWQYFFGFCAAVFGKDGYLVCQAKRQKAIASGESKEAGKLSEKMTKCALKASHHSFDMLATLPNVGYVPAYKPSPSFVATCGLASGTVVSYLQYNEALDKTKK